MEVVYESSFLKMVYFRSQELMEAIWLPATREMTTEQYRAEFLTYIIQYSRYKITKLLADEKQLLFQVDSEMQKWINKLVKETPNFQTEKIAIVYSDDFIQKINVKQMMSHVDLSHFNTLFFEQKEDAQKWLMTDKLNTKNKPVLLLYNNEYTNAFELLDYKEEQNKVV
ncbi:STAS/SEC14 domain-containing protein [Chondrinema litorale]|uniref:STAS/SEC14 domain-containing protein n=1 Tax=Chondrinema litorale TaxID=2994555 RepID=UPI0025427ECC|nr:STAS/SEC14 domain-containing protein [Chondrinema litorale]UZR96907.1 STAS/SEC14 domain-containing protein [Chondrinema litorale]